MSRGVALALLCALPACGDGDAPKKLDAAAKPQAGPQTSKYGIKVYVKDGETERLVSIAPAELARIRGEVTDPASPASSRPPQNDPQGPRPPGPSTQSAPRSGAESVGEIKQAATVTQADGSSSEVGDPTGWTLLKWAALSCETEPPTPSDELDNIYTAEPWIDGAHTEEEASWYIFHEPFDAQRFLGTCDDVLYRQEVLLCAADKLAQLGSSDATSYWDTKEYNAVTDARDLRTRPIKVTIPPQATKDRFIARDVALNALGHLAVLAQRMQMVQRADSSEYIWKTCADFFLDAANTGELYGANGYYHTSILFNAVVPYYAWYADPEPISRYEATLQQRKDIGRRRIDRTLNVLSAGARLTKELVEKSVTDDISGAQKAFASGGDARASALRAWGLDSDENPYNNLRHAFRTLYGRLELGQVDHGYGLQWFQHWITLDDPRCSRSSPTADITFGNGTSAADLLTLIGQGFDGRWKDIAPSTPGETFALSVLSNAGVVLPVEVIDDLGSSMSAVRGAVQELLVRRAADRAGKTYTAFKTSDEATAVRDTFTITDVTDAELRFALARNYDAFRLLTYSDFADKSNASAYVTALRAAAESLGIELRSAADASEIQMYGGVVLKAPIPRTALREDLYPRFAKAQSASNCGVYPKYSSPSGYRENAFSWLGTDVTALQNPFLLGEAFRREILHLGSSMTGPEAAPTQDYANLAAAEIRKWAGPGVVVREEDTSHSKAIYYLVDITPADLGAKDDGDLAGRLVLTDASFPHRASCLAATRDAELCPDALFAANSMDVIRPTSGITRDLNYPGTETYVRRIEFPLSTKDVHLVLQAKSGKPGRVLAALPYVKEYSEAGREFAAEIVSNFQRELTSRAFGAGKPATPERTCSGPASLALPRDYCIAGMQRDEFVPLANELTSAGSSSEDSWKHYLALAESASAKADEIAREMIKVGLDSDIRKETAGEEVSELCGTYPVNARATSGANGKVTVPGNDQAMQSCLNPPTVDLVFVGPDPLPIPEPGHDTPAAIKQDICNNFCPNGNNFPFCGKCSTSEEITHAGLGFVEHPAKVLASEQIGDPYAACREFAKAWNGFELDGAKYFAGVAQPFTKLEALTGAISQVSIQESLDRGWQLSIGNRPEDVVVRAVPIPNDPNQECRLEFPHAASGPLMGVDDRGVFQRLFNDIDANQASSCFPLYRGRAEAAVFYLGALAGGIPPGRIVLPVIAANTTAGAEFFSVQHAFGSAAFENISGYWHFSDAGYRGYAGVSLADKAIMPLVAAGSTPVKFFTDRGFSSASASGDKLLGLTVGNSAMSFAQNLVGGELTTRGGLTALKVGEIQGQLWTSYNTREFLPQWFADFGRSFLIEKYPVSVKLRLQTVGFQFSNVRYDGHADDLTGYPITDLDKLLAGPMRSVCNHAYMEPVFQRQFEGELLGHPVRNVCPNTGNGDLRCIRPLHHSYGGVEPENGITDFNGAVFIHDSADYNKFGLWETLGRQGGPKFRAFYPVGAVGQARWLEEPSTDLGGGFDIYYIGQDRLLPTQCPPQDRVELNMKTTVDDDQEAMATLMRSLTLACMADNAPRFLADLTVPPPPLRSMDDLRYFENWLVSYSNAIKRAVGAMVMMQLPKQSVDNIAAGLVGVEAAGQGERGKLLLQLENNLRDTATGLRDTGTLFQELAGQIRAVRLQIEGANLAGQQEQLAIALKALDNDRQLALAEAAQAREEIKRGLDTFVGIVEVIGGAFTGQAQLAMSGANKIFGAVTGAIMDAKFPTDLEIHQDFSGQVKANLAAQEDIARRITQNEVAQIVGSLSARLPTTLANIGDNLTQIRNSISDTEQTAISLRQLQAKAGVALAKAGGADFVQVNGQTVPLHVNTVYRRQFDVLKLRYERALEAAKRAAYLARLSIEERLGVRMADIHGTVGPLEAPALWVEDLCTVQGVDYAALREATPETDATGQAEIDKIAGFADQYVGDYVAKLREFIEFYNVENPFKEARDTALLSVREVLGDADNRCVAPSTNVLLYSDRLDVRPPLGAGPADNDRAEAGWLVTGCNPEACLDVQNGGGLLNGTTPLAPPDSSGGVTWLASIAKNAEWGVNASTIPSNIVYQSVTLAADGTYVLSWWDQSRATNGGPAEDLNPHVYPVAIYDASWSIVASERFQPSTDGWSERRSLIFKPGSDGVYHVAFAADLGSQTGASMAIANVQLEGGASTVEPSAYQQNLQARTRVTGKCGVDSPADFRGRFDYKCEATGCFYELRDLLHLDTQLLGQGFSPLTGKVASGNYNYRLGTVAVNIVGSGVLDCGQGQTSPSCNSSSYVEYDLSHAAGNVPIEDYAGTTRCFDFKTGSIRGGKALASERVLSLPLGSADASVIAQPAFSKAELMGRPLSGTYRLRIREAPGMVWRNIEDVQLLVNYDYWSRVNKASGG